MTRKAFYSFHYKPDNWRAAQVRKMGVIEGNVSASDNDWESIKKGGTQAIQKWIDNQMYGKSIAIVLIGQNTAGRKWINYEIKKAWGDGKGLLGIYIHTLKNKEGFQSQKGKNPFEEFTLDGKALSNIVKGYDPPYSASKSAYQYIYKNLSDWIEEAISIRQKYSN